ncbi:hypothetical protein ACA910_005559 [Epithemia clementina (nom. ined.)]
MGIEFQIVLEGNGAAVAGEHLQGYVIALVDSSEVKGSSLDVSFQGLERTQVEFDEWEGTGDNRHMRHRTLTSSRSILQIKIPTDDQTTSSFLARNSSSDGDKGNSIIASGKYQIPFDLELPDSLPGSMYHSKPDQGHCEIRYSINVILKGSGVLWNYHKEESVVVKSRRLPINEDPIPYDAPPVNEAVTAWCCWNAGSVSLGARLDDTKVAKGQTCQINVSCRNYSSVEITSVQAVLMQEIQWRAHSNTTHDRQLLVSLDFTKPLLLEGTLTAHSKEELRQARAQPDKIVSELADIYRDITSGKHSASFEIPRESSSLVLCTYSSPLVTIRHKLQLQITTAGCCIGQPNLTIPLLIGEAGAATNIGSQGNTTIDIKVEEEKPPAPYVPPSYEDAIQAPVIYVPSSQAHTGGIKVDGNDNGEPDIVFQDLTASNNNEKPSLELLLKEMAHSLADWDIVQSKARDSAWDSIFASLEPAQLGQILKQVELDFDQPKIAECVARQKAELSGGQFTCAFVVAAVQSTKEWNRATVVEKLLPFCSDLAQNQQLILQQLTDWEKLVTERAFTNALQQKQL